MKKNKGNMEKRRDKARERARKKRSLQKLKSLKKQGPIVIPRPGLPHMGAPDGFRSISMSQAIMEYAKPIMDYFDGSMDGLNQGMQIATLLWNYANDLEKGRKDEELEKLKKEALKVVRNMLNINEEEAQTLFTDMIERHRYLFPEEIQPAPPSMFMFIRKEVRHLIRPFDYSKITFTTEEAIPPSQDDIHFINKLNALDRHITKDSDYDEYEKLLLSLEEACCTLFEKWLKAKGFKDNAERYSHCLDMFLSFIYGYMHDDVVLLKAIPDIYFLEFFEDFLLRKMMAEPPEYVYWPPAIKMFYQYLYEKGYLTNHKDIIRQIDSVEPYFIAVLKKQFS